MRGVDFGLRNEKAKGQVMGKSAITPNILQRAIGLLAVCLFAAAGISGDAKCVIEAPKEIPIAYDVDVVVVGGSSGAVECACEAARQGASVFLLAPRPYVGSDICSTLRLWLEEGEQPKSRLAVACFGEERVTSPFAVKAAMDRALLEAGVSYLTGCYATDVLRDKDGRIAGVVMANRSGRQAVRAKVVVDATERAVVARLAEVKFRPFVSGPQTFKRVIIGGQMRNGDGMSGEKRDFTCDSVAKGTKHRLPVYEYTLRIDLENDDFRSFQRAENWARDMTYAAGSELASETLYHVPPDTIIGEGRLDWWPGADEAMLEAFRPKGTARLYVLNAYADLDGAAAAKLLRPLELIAMGRRIGQAAAAEAAELPALQDVRLPAVDTDRGIAVSVGEELRGIRSVALGTVHAGRRPLPVLGRYDVVVVGGGTSGAPAGIAAAKSGAKTLVVEYLHELGGVGTVGLIGAYWRGLRRGYTKYVDEQVNSREGRWNAVEKAEWLRRELIGSGAEVWLGSLGCGALVDDGRVRGVVVATPWGRGAVLADVVIDATGNADIAACAGAQTQYGISDRGSLNVQIAGFPDRPMKNSYVNTCYTMVDDTDVVDVWHLMTWKRVASPKEKGAFDVGQLVDSRERRRIVGDYILTTNDILNHRTFPDTISQHYSNFDAAAFPDAKLLLLEDAKGPNFHTDLPYRCLLPKGLDGILVVGLGSSSDRDAMTLIRMQPDLQNQGYAAGLAAAAAVKAGGHARDIDIKAIQKRLITEDVLDERVYTDADSYPMTPEAIEEAAWTIGSAEVRQIELLAALAVIVAHPKQAIPMLKRRHDSASTENAKLSYAKILGILGDPAGAPTLIAAVDAHDRWDAGVPLTSERKTGNTFSDLDRLVIALGFSRSPTAVDALLRKLEQLRTDDNLSHYKAISLALRNFNCPEAATPLAELLRRPRFAGHATVEAVVKQKSGNEDEVATVAERLITQGPSLNRAFKELIVAVMLYRCGDIDGKAKGILESYTNDIHGHFARYARQTLDGQVFGAKP